MAKRPSIDSQFDYLDEGSSMPPVPVFPAPPAGADPRWAPPGPSSSGQVPVPSAPVPVPVTAAPAPAMAATSGRSRLARWTGRRNARPAVEVAGVAYPSQSEIDRLYHRPGAPAAGLDAQDAAWGQVQSDSDLYAALAQRVGQWPAAEAAAGVADPITEPLRAVPVGLHKYLMASPAEPAGPAQPAAAAADDEPAATVSPAREETTPLTGSPQPASVPEPPLVIPEGIGMDPGWGGVPVEMSWHRGLSASRTAAAAPSVRIPGAPTSPVGDVLALRGLARRKAAASLLAAGLGSGERRKVVVGSVFAGVGVSTLTAVIAQTWAARGVPSLLLDGNRQRSRGLAARLSADTVTRYQWDSDVAALTTRIGQQSWTGAGGRSALIEGGTSAAGPAAADLAAAAAAEFASLVIVDGGSEDERLLRLAEQIVPDLLVLVCRLSAEELRTTADFLREVHRGGAVNCRRRAVVAAVGADSRWTREVKAALAAVTDVSAAVVTIGLTPALVARSAPAGAGDGGGAAMALSAAVAVAAR